MTHLKSLPSLALVSVTAAATLILIQACGGGAEAQTATDADPIEGVWESSVTIRDCASNAVLRTFKGESLFHRGGSLSADNSLAPPTRSTSFGNWRHGGGSGYSANFRFLRFNPDGTLAGSQKVARAITLAADGNAFSGTISGQVLDPAELVVGAVCGTETAVRIY